MRPKAVSWRRLAVAGIGALGAMAALTGALSAHPLGNFTINHYAGLQVSPTAIDVDFILDMAEIPTFQERQRIDLNADGTVDAAEIETERQAACPLAATELRLVAAGVPLALTPTAAGLSFPRGTSGLETMRLVCEFTAPLPAPITSPTTVTFEDRTWSLRIGWREITATGEGVTIAGGGVPATSPSRRLTAYPQDLLADPVAMQSATVQVTPGGPSRAAFVAPDASPLRAAVAPTSSPAPSVGASGSHGPVVSTPAAAGSPSGAGSGVGSPAASAAPSPGASPAVQIGAIPGGVTDEISRILEVRDLTPLAVIASLLAAAFLGALHAVSPGHGKTVMAAYLVGSRGSARHAIALGLTVTVSHTLGVLALATLTLSASSIFPPERLYPVLGLLSGALVVGIGLWLLYGRYRIWVRTRADAKRHDDARHDHGPAAAHSHPEMLGHSHPADARPQLAGASTLRRYGGGGAALAMADVRPDVSGEHSHGGFRHSHLPRSGADLTWRSLFSLGLAGGLVPSASALLLLLGSLAANRPAYGVILVVAFGAGMAVVLAGVGLLLVYATRFVERIPTGTAGRRLWDLLPVATAVVVIGAGLYLTSQAITQVF